MNPYDELGVAPDAPASDIRRAYRRRAKATHPDHGGDAAAFQRAKRASLVLLDPTKRAKFDQSGVIDEEAPDNELAEVLVAVAQFIDAALVQCMQTGRDPSTLNMIEMIGSLAKTARDGVTVRRQEVEKHLVLSEKIAGRFKAKMKGEPNRIEGLITARIAAQRATIAMLAREVEKIDRAVMFLKDYRFEWNDPLALNHPWFSMNTAATNWL